VELREALYNRIADFTDRVSPLEALAVVSNLAGRMTLFLDKSQITGEDCAKLMVSAMMEGMDYARETERELITLGVRFPIPKI